MLHNFRVNPGYSINRMRADDTQVGHIDPFAVPFLDHRHPSEAINVPGEEGCHVLPGHNG